MLQPQGIKRLKALEAQNSKLKKRLAEPDLEIDLMREIDRKKLQARRRGASGSPVLAMAACRSRVPAG
ncbi:MAG: hypothetical protein IH606_03465 [Burkholderiales bacterium]|nr:hypothetical protein [Burkholderiales bacterium]